MYLLATCTFFGEMSIQVFCLFLNWVVCLFSHWVIRVLYAGYYTLIRYRVKSMLFSSVHYILFFSVAFFAARKFLILRMHNLSIFPFLLVQLSSATHSCLTLCDPMDCSTPGFPVHHQLPELAQTHVHRVCDAIKPSYFLSSPSPPAFNLSTIRVFQMSQFFASGGQSIGVSAPASVLPMNIQDWFPLGWTGLREVRRRTL